MRLSELHTGDSGFIVKVMGRSSFRRRIMEMGFIQGQEVEVVLNAPLKDPIKYRVMGYEVSLRQSEAKLIEVVLNHEQEHAFDRMASIDSSDYRLQPVAAKHIHVALVGNPNAGKTSFFNVAAGAHEHVGNYGGVTIDAKEGYFKHRGYHFKIVDLPGTYSLSAYSPEEIYVRKYITEQTPDIVINVIDASNLERNLYLTTQLIDMDTYMVIALNMYDELESGGDRFDYEQFGKMIGVPVMPTVSSRGKGVIELFDRIVSMYEVNDSDMRHIHINYGEVLESAIAEVREKLRTATDIGKNYSKRYLSITLLEHDRETERFIREQKQYREILDVRDHQVKNTEMLLHEDSVSSFANFRYGFITGALKDTFVKNEAKSPNITDIIDPIVTHKYLGYPIFLLFMWIMFAGTFILGKYPMAWIESGVNRLGDFAGKYMSDGSLKDLITDGIIGGVGGVIVFLPNILILYFFISLMEDSGYMARAAFIMDKVMHKMGLHGKSFIPLIMGFGCNVPAIMATRTIESRNSRMITILVNPLMSCSARLPVYLLLAGTFFPDRAGLMMVILYTSGIILAVLIARIFKRFLFTKEDVPFVMELPPYRKPTSLSILRHMWQKARQYLRKMGGVILIASIVIWFLGYFPRNTQAEPDGLLANQTQQIDNGQAFDHIKAQQKMAHQEKSYIGRIGKFIEPVLRPLGFDWRTSISLLSGLAAKEVVVSTLGVLYMGNDADDTQLSAKLQAARKADGLSAFTPLTALSLMFFVLIYFPCIASVLAIKNESGSWKWGIFAILYTTVLAWLVSFSIYQIGNWLL